MSVNNSNLANDGTGSTPVPEYNTYNMPVSNPPQRSSRFPWSPVWNRWNESSPNSSNNIHQLLFGLHPLVCGAHAHAHAHAHHCPRAHRTCYGQWFGGTHEPAYAIRPGNSDVAMINLDGNYRGTHSPIRTNVNRNIPELSQSTLPSSEARDRVNHENVIIPIDENDSSTTQNNVGGSSNNNNNNSISPSDEGIHNHHYPHSSGNELVDTFINNYLPFLSFLVMKSMYDHREGIIIFVGLLITFVHANSVCKREIAKQSRRSLLSLGIIFVNIFVCICFIYFVFREQHLYKSLIFLPPHNPPKNFWDLLWMVGITDFVLKYITILLKVGLACFPAKLFPYSVRGKWYLMIESTSQLYRCLVPVQPWLFYFMETYPNSEHPVGMFFSVAYMVSKGSDLMSKIKLFGGAFYKLLQNANLGVRPSKEQLDTSASQCPICHDEYISPIMLNCRHIFCEGCVMTWFDREQTCPLCRAKIADDPTWRDGSTSFFIQLF